MMHHQSSGCGQGVSPVTKPCGEFWFIEARAAEAKAKATARAKASAALNAASALASRAVASDGSG